MTLEERDAFEAWKGNGANHAALAELEQLWTAVGMVRICEAVRATVAGASPAVGRRALVAAMCAASLGLGMILYPQQRFLDGTRSDNC
jgi:ferric-dicitrate binding protein FerR (iron transport regulator)